MILLLIVIITTKLKSLQFASFWVVWYWWADQLPSSLTQNSLVRLCSRTLVMFWAALSYTSVLFRSLSWCLQIVEYNCCAATEMYKENKLTLMLFSSVSAQVLPINITWLLIQCQNPFTYQIPTPGKSTKPSLSLKQRIWPKMQTWWQEQVISAFLSTRVTVGTGERQLRPLSTAQEVRKVWIWGTQGWSPVFLSLFRNSDATGCTKMCLWQWFNQLLSQITSWGSLMSAVQPVLYERSAWAEGSS